MGNRHSAMPIGADLPFLAGVCTSAKPQGLEYLALVRGVVQQRLVNGRSMLVIQCSSRVSHSPAPPIRPRVSDDETCGLTAHTNNLHSNDRLLCDANRHAPPLRLGFRVR